MQLRNLGQQPQQKNNPIAMVIGKQMVTLSLVQSFGFMTKVPTIPPCKFRRALKKKKHNGQTVLLNQQFSCKGEKGKTFI